MVEKKMFAKTVTTTTPVTDVVSCTCTRPEAET